MSEGILYYWVANWNLSRAVAARALNNHVADMVDCTGAHVGGVLAAKPKVEAIAGYVTGGPGIQWTVEDFTRAEQEGYKPVYIDQSNSARPLAANVRVAVKDSETGASSIDSAVVVSKDRVNAGEIAVIYCSQSILSEVENTVAGAGMKPGHIIAFQYASPSVKPSLLVPGISRTIGELQCDLSVVDPALFFVAPKPDSVVRAEVTLDPDSNTWTIKGHG